MLIRMMLPHRFSGAVRTLALPPSHTEVAIARQGRGRTGLAPWPWVCITWPLVGAASLVVTGPARVAPG